MKRLLTAAVTIPLALASVFYLPAPWFFLLLVAIVEVQVFEFVRVTRPRAPHAPLEALLLLVPPAALLLSPGAFWGAPAGVSWEYLLAVTMLLSVGVGSVVLLGRTPVEEAVSALGILSFGIAYFALPIASIHYLQRLDPWILLLLLAIVWVGDSGAYLVGTRWGRRKLAPVVSPNKTWLGAVAGFLTALAGAVLWCVLRYQGIEPAILAAAAGAAIAAQLGDLVESLFKRGAGVKDSGDLLPGHGGMLDRMDAGLLAAPTLYLALRAFGVGS